MRPKSMQLTHVYLEQVEIFVCRSIFSSCDPAHSGYTGLPSVSAQPPGAALDSRFWSESPCWSPAIWETIQSFVEDLFSAHYISRPCKASENQTVHPAAPKALGRAEAAAGPLSECRNRPEYRLHGLAWLAPAGREPRVGEGRVFSSEGMSELFFFFSKNGATAKRRKDEGLPENGQYMRKGAEALKARVCEGLLVVWRGRSTRRQEAATADSLQR